MIPADNEGNPSFFVSPWRIPYSFGNLDCSVTGCKFGERVGIVTLLTDWVDLLCPGDEIQLVDQTSMYPWLGGNVTFAKKVFLCDITQDDLRLLGKLISTGIAGEEITIEYLQRWLADEYQEEVDICRPVAVIGIHVTEVMCATCPLGATTPKSAYNEQRTERE